MKIWKYDLQITDHQNIAMPLGAKILTAQIQGSTLCIWALVNAANPLQERTIRVIGTGNLFPEGDTCRYIGSVQERIFVWHVFEAWP